MCDRLLLAFLTFLPQMDSSLIKASVARPFRMPLK